MKPTGFLLMGVLAVGTAPAGAEDLAVFVTAASPTAVAPAADGEPGPDALAKQQKDMEDGLKRQYGKNPGKWPPDKMAEFDALAARIRRLSFDNSFRNYGGSELKDVEKSVAGIRESLAGKKGVRLVSTAEEADLRVEVLGRFVGRDDFSGGLAAKIGIRVCAGGRLDPALLAKSPLRWPYHGSAMAGASAFALHHYSADEPYWLVQVERPAGAFGPLVYGKVEDHAAGSLEKLAKESGSALAAVRRTASR